MYIADKFNIFNQNWKIDKVGHQQFPPKKNKDKNINLSLISLGIGLPPTHLINFSYIFTIHL